MAAAIESGRSETGLGHLATRFRLEGCPVLAVRPEGANHQWRKIPSRELSIELEADEQLGWATGRAGAS